MRKILYNSGIRLMYSLLFLLLVHSSYSQEKTIQIIDKKTEGGIPDVHFRYNKTRGFSDRYGNIVLRLEDGTELFLSHLQYGKVAFISSEVEKLADKGVVALEKSSTYLPATVVLVHPTAGDKRKMEFTVQNKLAHDAGNLLESVPSISTIRKSGAYGFDPVLRGFKYDQINLVLDGSQTASAACPNRMDPAASQIPINMIAEAEVLKGPHSLRYGNAFGGTINFKSTSPEFKEKATPVGRFGTSYESNGNIFRTEGVAGVSGSKVDFRMFGAYSTGDDYTDGEGVDIAARFNRLNWGGKLGVKLSQTQKLGVLVSNNVAKNVDFPALPMDLREDNTWLVNASHSAVFYDKTLTSWNTSVYGTMVDHRMDNYDKILDPRMVDAITDAETRNYGGRTEMRFDLDKSYLYAGVDYRFESADGYRERTMLMGPMAGKILTDNVWQDAEIKRTGFFGEWHIAQPGFQFVISGRLDINSAKANNADPRFESIYSSLESSHVHPSLSVGGTRLFNENISLGLWMGMATRSPGIAERYINQFPIGLDPYEMLGNPDLDPEINNQLDLVFRYQTEKTNLNINVFTSVLRDYISSEIREDLQPAMNTSPGVRQFVNIKKALMTGFEASWTQQFSSFISHDLGIVYTHGQNQELDEPLPEIPPLEFHYRLMGSLTGDKVKPEIVFRHAMKQDRIAKSYGENETPAFSVVDAKVSWLMNDVFTTTGGVQNLFDNAYYEHLSRSVRSVGARPIYSPGRSFYVTLTISFL
ncbi:TonB-dependent receptor domain-containing protein [Draconibacterium halophilum]|uniref:TonB-dependent receptor n=1 Tax=Draconibacterium halophilum TaxID=2706887 RepID=A0A6C0RDI8_9BACT|nr:TonB-dependent receptor [Draconibacterium halophilum]QIA07996.1 TonB-dependent receptor [Draconibacterium halophilum]